MPPSSSSSSIPGPLHPPNSATQTPSSSTTLHLPLLRRREWNRAPLRDLFPRMPASSLEQILDVLIGKNLTYDLSTSSRANARRLTCMVIANVRHTRTPYDELLRGGGGGGGGGGEDGGKVGRWEARTRTADQVWKVIREWCPWDDSNPVLEECFRATLLRPEERGPGWWEGEEMEVDGSEYGGDEERGEEKEEGEEGDGDAAVEDPMDLD